MTNTPTREHREASYDLAEYLCSAFHERPWREVQERILKDLAAAEQFGYERGLADRDERCLQSDMQRIREKLAVERGRETERAEVVMWLRSQMMPAIAELIGTGKHLAKGRE